MTSDHIQFETQGAIGLIVLNRPEALNALTFDMIAALDDRLAAWADDASVAAVVIRGAGDHFCAGGDVRRLYTAGPEALEENAEFYAREYRMNRRIKTFPKPYIALMQGATMGGGAGVSINGRYRVGAETLKFAMPEVAIGFAPDVGGTYFLSRMPNNIGFWVGASAAQLGVADAMYSHVVDYFIRKERFDSVVGALAAADYADDADEAVCEVLAMNASATDAPSLKANVDEIDAAFSAETIESALAGLDGGSDWAKSQAAAIRSQCPRSVKVAFGMLQAGRAQSYEACLANEFRMAKTMVAHPDFFEGVRAKLIDRDNSPKWADASVADVSDDLVKTILTPAADDWTP